MQGLQANRLQTLCFYIPKSLFRLSDLLTYIDSTIGEFWRLVINGIKYAYTLPFENE